jgi:hypothetical protein
MLLFVFFCRKNNAEGMAYLQVAMDKDWQKIISCCQLIYYFLMGEDKKDEAKIYQEKITQQEQKLMLAQQERNYISEKDTFTEHNLDHETLDNLCQQLQQYAIKRAHLVQKVLQYFPENPCYVLLVQRKLKFIEGDRNTEEQNLLNQLTQTIQFPYYLYIIIDNDSSFNGCSNKIRKVNNSQIYQQQK